LTSLSNKTGSTITLRGTASNRLERIGITFCGRSEKSMLRFSTAHWPDQAFPTAIASHVRPSRGPQGGQLAQPRPLRVHLVDHALLRVTARERGQEHPAHVVRSALPCSML